jgi:uncharacterized protein YkwD
MLSTRTHRPRLGRAIAVALLVSTSAMAGEGAAGDPVPDLRTSLDRVEAAAVDPVGIDTSDRSAVLDAWRAMIEAREGATADWTGRPRDCRPGRASDESATTILDGVNFARGLAGLAPVRFQRSLSVRAQKAALIMTANGALSHHVPRSWSCWSRVGAAAASRSNLYYGSRTLRPEDVVPAYLTDRGSENVAVGHRRWILNPAASAFGNGLTTTSHAMYVVGPTSTQNPNPAWVPWPTAGWFPSDLEPDGRWSLASGSAGADLARARVTVRRDGTRVKVRRHPFVRGFGMPTISWEIDGAVGAGTYTVTVSGIRGAAAPRVTYDVRVFDPRAG